MDLALRLSRQIAAIDDPELRARRAAELLRALSADEAVRALADLLRLADRRSDPASVALEGTLRALREQLDEADRARLRIAAEAAEELEVMALLSAAAAVRSFDRDKEPWVDRAMRAKTLGERKALARGHDRDRLARLLSDPDPAVLRHLLENPRITERDVLVAASRRPVRSGVLEEIFRSRRWAQNRRVRRAIALNPYSEPSLASAALALLTVPDLREVVGSAQLSAEVRLQARRLIAHRSGRPEEAVATPDEPAPVPVAPPRAQRHAKTLREQVLERSRTLQDSALGRKLSLEERAAELQLLVGRLTPDESAD